MYKALFSHNRDSVKKGVRRGEEKLYDQGSHDSNVP